MRMLSIKITKDNKIVNELHTKWKKMMCQKASEGVISNISSESTCRLKTGEFIHRGLTCDGCRYDNPLNVY